MDEFKESKINAKVFAHSFYEICENLRAPFKISNAGKKSSEIKCNELVIDFIARIKKSIENGRCDAETFIKEMIKMNSFKLFKIEIWWYLLKCGVLSAKDLFQIFNSHDYQYITEYFLECLSRNIFHYSGGSAYMKKMNSNFIELLLIHNESCNLEQIHCLVYNLLLKCVSSKDIIENNQEIMSIDSVVEILETTTLNNSVKKSFLLDLIKVLLQGKSKTPVTLTNNDMQIVNYGKLNVKKCSKISEILDLEDITSHLKKIFLNNSKPVHWQNVFYLLSCLITYYKDAVKNLKDLILHLLEDAFRNLNKTSLLYSFILSRQCSLHVPAFPSYLNWFSATFSAESSRPINTREKAVFFMDFLNEITEFDSPYYLKVHINRAPCLPLECHSLVADYVKLVKTKLIDLNESAELGLFENFSSTTSPEFDVETALKIYSHTNEVPKCVLEASLFCKSYYEKKFLVTLLSNYEGKDSVRHKFITELQSFGKIPNSLYSNYRRLM